MFCLDKNIFSIHCKKEDKIGPICQEYSKRISKDINSLSFLHEGNKINFQLSFENYANGKNEITILVNKKFDENIIIPNKEKTNKIDDLYNINKNKKIEIDSKKIIFDKIKSKYLIKIIFSYIHEKIKLKTIKCNKYLQNRLNIEFINYQLFSKRYKKLEKNGLISEYDYNNNLVFKGEYLNEERNGKGKEYIYDNKKKILIFEGEYLKGMKNGKGKEYYSNGEIKFGGEYINNKRWNGTMHDFENKDITYKLEKGKGFIKEYEFNNEYTIYEGEYLNGKGKLYNFDKLYFEGEFKCGKKWNGIGYDEKNEIIYELKEGKGLIKKNCKFNDLNENLEIKLGKYFYRLKIDGEYNNGELNGKVKIYNDDLILEGEFLNGKLNGLVKEYYENELRFDGEYLYNFKLRGKEYIEERLEFNGDYLFDKKWNGNGYDEKGNIIYTLKNGTGKIKIYDQKGIIEFEGEIINGIMNGKGKKYSNGKLIFDGEFLNGKRNGKGIEYSSYGGIKFEGEYKNDKIWKGKGSDYESSISFEGEYKNGKRWNGYGRARGCGIEQNRFLFVYKNGKQTIKINKSIY